MSAVIRDIREAIDRAAPQSDDNELWLTQDALALRLGTEWRDRARYVDAWGRWMFYRDGIWQADETKEHWTLAREFLREIAAGLPAKYESAGKILRRKDTVAAVIFLAQSNPTQAATVSQWDADPWVLGTPAGVVDLRTGRIRPARPEDYLTKAAAVAPAAPGTPAPLWTAFLDRITAGDTALQSYLKRAIGYALTGSIREHAFMFGHGTGANGKGVFLNTIKGILGEYAVVIPVEMLMVSNNDRHPTELARLRGARLAIGSETEQGKRWAEAKIKALTGGDPVAARYMRQDFFEFEPQFKLFVVGNHRPSLRGVDEAMRRRLHLIPFTVTIPPEERDHELPEKLRAEWPAILRWAIEGCLEWQEHGLNPPDTVRAATEEYLDAEDAVGLWLDECTETTDPDAFEPGAALFASWRRWTERTGEFTGTQKRFGQVLEERGFARHRQAGTGTRGFRGIRLTEDLNGGRWEP